MKPFASLVLGLTLWVFAGAATAQVNALPPTPHILVYGEAQARAVPDRFRIEVALEVVDPSADAARRKVEASLADILGLLGKAGVPEDEVVATSLEIQPHTRFDQLKREQVYEGIRVSRTVTARFDDQSSLQAFLAALETSGEVQVSGVETQLADEAELKRQLREKAIEDTRRKAEVIAGSYGVRLVGLYSVSDVAPEFDYGIQEGDWPYTYEWDESAGTLDRVTVTGSRLGPDDVETFQAGLVDFEDRIYAVFLISE